MKKLLVVILLLSSQITFSQGTSLGKAMAWSIIPGGGQLHNERVSRNLQVDLNDHWWRFPIYSGTVVVSSYFVVKNQREMSLRKNEWQSRINFDSDINDPINAQFKGMPTSMLWSEYETYKSKRNTALFFGVFAYTASIVDTYISHRMIQKNRKLGIHVAPSPVNNGVQLGASIRL